MKRIFALLLCVISFCSLYGLAETLPKPTGKYFVGVTYLSFVDKGRKEIFDPKQESYRAITVKAWYPVDRQSTPEPYLLKAEAEFVTEYLQFPALYKDLMTNAGRDLPLSAKENKYPALIFSHGWGEHYAQNTILMEELASHGYVVFSVAHHYECKFSSFPDGRLVRIEMNNPRFQKMIQEQMNPKAMGLFEKLKSATSDEERFLVFLEANATLPMCLTESPRYWAEDIAFFIDRLKIMNEEDARFKNKLNLERIGIFGMSMGGIAASELCSTDERIKAGASIDGGFYGPSNATRDVKYRVPFLFLNSARFLGCGALFAGKSAQDCFSLTVKGSDHYNFSDYSIFPVPSVRALLGPIDGKKTIEIMNVIVPAFFDKYLKDRQIIDVVKKAKAYPEIEIATNKH